MRAINLNGAKMTDRAATHAYLKRKLALPDYYGENLDALWDCLSTDFSGKTITIHKVETIIDNLGPYGEALIKLFQDAATGNHCLVVIFKDK